MKMLLAAGVIITVLLLITRYFTNTKKWQEPTGLIISSIVFYAIMLIALLTNMQGIAPAFIIVPAISIVGLLLSWHETRKIGWVYGLLLLSNIAIIMVASMFYYAD